MYLHHYAFTPIVSTNYNYQRKSRIKFSNGTSPTTKKKKPITNIFISANRFSPIAPSNEPRPLETTGINPIILMIIKLLNHHLPSSFKNE